MARRRHRPAPTAAVTLDCQQNQCPACHHLLWVAYHRHRCVTTLAAVVALTVRMRRCVQPLCSLYHLPYRPEEEGAWVLPQAEVGLDVIALVGALRYRQHQSVPEIHHSQHQRGLDLAERTITNLLARYDELVALRHADNSHLHDVRPPLAAPGLKLAERLQAIDESLQRVTAKRDCQPICADSTDWLATASPPPHPPSPKFVRPTLCSITPPTSWPITTPATASPCARPTIGSSRRLPPSEKPSGHSRPPLSNFAE